MGDGESSYSVTYRMIRKTFCVEHKLMLSFSVYSRYVHVDLDGTPPYVYNP